MKTLTENIKFAEAIPAAAYATATAANDAAVEFDKEDAQNIVMLVDAGTVGDEIVVTLQGADTSGGEFADLKGTDGETATVTLTEAGLGKVEVKATELKPYLQANVESIDETGGADEFGVILVAGNYGVLPVE